MELPHLGEHCHLQHCNQLDYLPVKCQLCTQIFCSNHWKPEKHHCEKIHLIKDVKVEVCKKCNKRLNEDHKCEKKKKSKCSVENCKSKVLIALTCSECFQKLCPKHRFPADHNCNDLLRRTANLRLVAVTS